MLVFKSRVADQKGGTRILIQEELKGLSRLKESLRCQRHELIGCERGGNGLPDLSLGEDSSTRNYSTMEVTI